MKKIIALAGLSIALPLAAAAAQELPKWPTGAACSPGDDACPAFESEYRGQVSGLWSTLPPKIRSKCVSETEPVEKSYRLLYDCLANEMQAFTKNQQRSPEGGEVVQLTPPAKTPEPEPQASGSAQPAQGQIPPTQSQPSPPLAVQPSAPAPSGPAATESAPTPPNEAKQPVQSEVTPPAAGQASPPVASPSPPSTAQPAPPTATEPTPTAPAPKQ